jgi:hypothetical protein
MLIINIFIVGQVIVLLLFFLFNISTEILSFQFTYLFYPIIYWYPVMLNIPIMIILFEQRDFKLIYQKFNFKKIFKKK